MFRKSILLVCIGVASGNVLFSQPTSGTILGEDNNKYNVIKTPVPFLNITPESRGGAMGDAGVATTPDESSQHWNPSKYAFIKEDWGLSASYSPWLRHLASDINLFYLAGHKRIDARQTVSMSLRYFSLGQILFTNNEGQAQGTKTPNEFTIDAGYSALLSENFSLGMAFRFIRSDLSGGSYIEGVGPGSAGTAFAADVSGYYQKPVMLQGMNCLMAYGLNISNIGSKISYSQSSVKDFIPTNLKLGGSLKMNLDPYNSLDVALDLNKLLVPTPDTSGRTPDVSVPSGIIQSLYKAPGGAKEKFQEIMWSFGTEYWYREQFALRGGYFYEAPNKGNRQYFTLGLGLRLNVAKFDFSYLIPASKSNNALANTMRFTVAFNFEKTKKNAPPVQ
jgi:hypothetical protein